MKEITKVDPNRIWIDDDKYTRGEKITRVQSMKKFKNDCIAAGGEWSASDTVEYGTLEGKCSLQKVSRALVQDVDSNFSHQKSAMSYEYPEQLRRSLYERFAEENYMVVELVALLPKQKGEIIEREAQLAVFGLTTSPSPEQSRLHLIEKHRRQEKPHEVRVRVDARPFIPYDLPKELGDAVMPTGFPIPTAVATMSIGFEKPKKCDVKAYSSLRTPSNAFPRTGLFGNVEKDKELLAIESVRVDCYL